MKYEEGSPEHIAALLESVTERIPKLVNGLVKSIYSADTGTSIGQAVGNLYKELLASGIPKDEAIKMAKDYMLSITKIMKNVKMDEGNGENADQSDSDDDQG